MVGLGDHRGRRRRRNHRSPSHFHERGRKRPRRRHCPDGAAMKIRSSIFALLLLGSVAAQACAPGSGQVSLEFIWESPPPPSTDYSKYWLHAAVEERTDPDLPGKILGTDTAT